MKYRLGIIAVCLVTVVAVIVIQSFPAFAALDDSCTCVDEIDAAETCIAYCGMGGNPEPCLAISLLTPKGACLMGSRCLTQWLLICQSGGTVKYWQYIDCFTQCWRQV